ncbi:MAG: prolipoprotein diacylglyceryl transferase [Bacteroidetes bacterium]|nr:prolipoprotein diacylglyceryl transferase [Bacteroidota bacterium]
MSWLQKLQTRWNAKNIWQVIAILLVFCCTGMTVVALARPLLHFFFGAEIPTWAKVVYYILILPVYNIVLLMYGFLFGQFHFFYAFEKRFFTRMRGLFRKKE